MKRGFLFLLLIAAMNTHALAQQAVPDNDDVQLWPDVTLGFRLTPKVALQFFGTIRPGANLTRIVGEQTGIAVNLRLNKYLSIVPAYRAVWSQPDETRNSFEHRYFGDVIPRLPLGKGFAIQDRNRFERRDINGQWAWRYRNRPQIEKVVTFHDRQLTPYLAVEFFYDSRPQAWVRKQFWAGMRVPFGSHVTLDVHYAQSRDQRARPGRWHVFGLMTRMEF